MNSQWRYLSRAIKCLKFWSRLIATRKLLSSIILHCCRLLKTICLTNFLAMNSVNYTDVRGSCTHDNFLRLNRMCPCWHSTVCQIHYVKWQTYISNLKIPPSPHSILHTKFDNKFHYAFIMITMLPRKILYSYPVIYSSIIIIVWNHLLLLISLLFLDQLLILQVHSV